MTQLMSAIGTRQEDILDPRSHLLQCAVCAAIEGQIVDDSVRRLGEIRLKSKFAVNRGEPTTITICNRCSGNLVINIDKLVDLIDSEVAIKTADDVAIEGFLRIYLSEIYPHDTVPSYQVLCRVLNAVGLVAPRGGKWEYHNLQQRMARMDISREAILMERAKRSYRERMDILIARAAVLTQQDLANITTEHEARDGVSEQTDEVWQPKEPIGMPADMPGL